MRHTAMICTMIVGATLALGIGASSAQAVHWDRVVGLPSYVDGPKRWGAILYDIPWGASWENTCATTAGLQNRPPDECMNLGTNIYGVWSIAQSHGDRSEGLHWSDNAESAREPGRVQLT